MAAHYCALQVAQTDPVLAAKLEDFLVGRLERIETCEGSNSGMQYDTEAGECVVGECASGSYKVRQLLRSIAAFKVSCYHN